MTLTEFLLARVREDERRAGEVFPFGDMGEDEDYEVLWAKRDRWDEQAHSRKCGYQHATTNAECSCSWPARLLAECEAKRRIVDWHELMENPEAPYADGSFWRSCRCLDGVDFEREGCPTLLALALPYADHPDYRQEWAVC